MGFQYPCTKIFCLYNSGMDTQRGRPPKADEERREYRFQIRLSDEERELIERAGEGQPSTWARETLLKAARRKLKGE